MEHKWVIIKCYAINGLVLIESSNGFNGQLNNSKGVQCDIWAICDEFINLFNEFNWWNNFNSIYQNIIVNYEFWFSGY